MPRLGLVAAAYLLFLTGAPAWAESPVSHDQEGHVVIHAVRITQPITVDGRLDEEVYGALDPMTEFIQQDPASGEPVSEKTEAWVLFDDHQLYIVCRCWDSQPDRIVANEMRRDSAGIRNSDNFGVSIDTFFDHRNGFMFYANAAGGMYDALVTDERVDNADWNGVWNASAGRFEGGYTLEIAIPFDSLRYKAGRDQTWGMQIRRFIPHNNERVYITPVSQAFGITGLTRMSGAGTLVGVQAPAGGARTEIKPYGISRLTTDALVRPPVRNDVDADVGLDVKYGLTKGLTADFTLNTDFAQVESDEAQVNLTRFNLFFPEKREFFLEGQGIFTFGRGIGNEGRDPDSPTIFHSRRIALAGSRQVPLLGGGRLTGKAGPFSIGAVSLETGEDAVANVPRTNFTVLRLRRDIFRRSTVGGIFTRRSVGSALPGANYVWGLDGAVAFTEFASANAFIAQSRTPALRGDDLTYDGQFNYNHDRYGFSIERLVLEPHFNPDIGFLPREDYQRNYVSGRFSPRPKNSRHIRKMTYQANLEYITDNDNVMESREQRADISSEFQNSDILSLGYRRIFEFVPAPFRLSDTASIGPGGYNFDNTVFRYSAGPQRRNSGSVTLEYGSFYDGHKNTITYRGRSELTPRLNVEPSLTLHWIDLPQQSFRTTVMGSRVTFTLTPRMFIAALVQYASNNTSLSTNLRLRWEYRPGSELFVVYTEGRDTLPTHGTMLENRGLVIKANRLLRF